MICANEECDKDITKRFELTGSPLCAGCKELLGDDFKWRMKTVGFNEEPTIARTEEDWKVLEKQKQVKDI